MATIEELNNEYSKENNILKKLTAPGGLKDKMAQFQENFNLKIRDFKIKDAELSYALSRNDKTGAETAKKDLETLRKDIADLQSNLQKAADFLSKQQEIVNEKFAELSKNPEIKQKLDSILYKKYNRKKNEEINKKHQLENIKQIINQHPNVQKWLNGIEGYGKAIRNAQKKLDAFAAKGLSSLNDDELQDYNDALTEKSASETKLAERRNDLISFFDKNHPEIDKDILLNIHSYGNIDRQIAGCEKSINNYDKAMDNLSVTRDISSSSSSISEQSYSYGSSTDLVTQEKPSWLHPIKRIKYAINKRKARNSNSANITSPQDTKSEFLNNVKLSKDEYNSEIVQKYLNEKYKENLHNVSRQKDTDSQSR